MFHYVKGLLVSNEPGARAPGTVEPVDRWPVIQTSGEITIRAFDHIYVPEAGALLSKFDGVSEGNTYTFLLTVLAKHIETSASTTHPLHGAEVWQGTIIDPQWVLPDQGYLAVYPPATGTVRGVLVETTIGQVIISHRHLGEFFHPPTFQQGDAIRWNHIRWSLLAILPAAS